MRFTSLMMALVALIFSQNCLAETLDTLRIHRKGNVESMLMLTLDSITHSDERMIKINRKTDDVVYPATDIDSITYHPSSLNCLRIREDGLNGWDEGIYCEDITTGEKVVITSMTDSIEGVKTVFLNVDGNEKIEDGVLLTFNIDNQLLDIFTSNYRFEVHYTDYGVLMAVYDNDSKYIDSIEVPYDDYLQRINGIYKIEHYRIVALRKMLAAVGKGLYYTGSYGNLLEDGRYGDIARDITTDVLTDKLLPTTTPFISGVFIGEGIKSFLNLQYERMKNSFMGNAGIEITSIKRTGPSTVTVEGEISNIETIPSSRLTGGFNFISNYVWFGVAEGDSGQPGLYLNDNCSNLAIVSSNHFKRQVNLPYKVGKTFYFRPFLIPECTMPDEDKSFGENINERIGTCIRYGSRKEFTDKTPTCSTGECISITNKAATVRVTFNDADGFECGVMVSGENVDKRITTTDENGEHEIVISGLEPGTAYNYCAYVDIDGKPINGEMKEFTTTENEIPDLSGEWTFHQAYLAKSPIIANLKYVESGEDWTSYRASGFYGVNNLTCTVYADGFINIRLNALNGAFGEFEGYFNDAFTFVSGESYLYNFGNNNWAVEPAVYNKPWTFSR